MITLLLALALLVAIIHLALDRRRPHPDEFDDVRSLQRSCDQRAALQRATRRHL